MNEDFVSYDLAVKLKEKGFRKFCFAGYNKEGRLIKNGFPVEDGFVEYDMFLQCHNLRPNAFDAPTISQALKWLREEKRLHIEIAIFDSKYFPVIVYIDIPDEEIVHCSKTIYLDNEITFDSYEEAAIASIEYVIDNLL